MNYTHFHLIINQITVYGSVIGFILIIFGFYKNNEELKRKALYVFIAVALTSILVYLSGKSSFEEISGADSVTIELIRQHEILAFYCLIMMLITGILAFICLLVSKDLLVKKLVTVTLISSVFSTFLIIWTGDMGGQIRHIKIRNKSLQTKIRGEQ